MLYMQKRPDDLPKFLNLNEQKYVIIYVHKFKRP
jgi:hypothetical protein